MHKDTKPFEVRFTILVDRPELRGPTYPVVKPGTKILTTWRFYTQAAAINCFENLMYGESDFRSEYVMSVQVYEVRPGRKSRTIRKLRARSRRESEFETDVAKLAVHAKRTNPHHLYFDVFRPYSRNKEECSSVLPP